MRTKHAVQVTLSTFILVGLLARESRQNSIQNKTVLCDNISQRVEVCAKPIMDLLYGTLEVWPSSEKDVEDNCATFGETERCIKDLGRKCAKGLQRTIISTVASSVQRARKRECTKARYPLLLKTYQVLEGVQAGTRNLMNNSTIKMALVDTQMKDPDQKTMAVCCLVYEVENLIKVNLAKHPNELKVVISIYRAILEDVMELVCRAPKCNDIFRGYKFPKTLPGRGLIDIILSIMFSLDAESV